MLGKNNFKERLRKMENQDKHDRFSIRKLSIGVASVLIGFAFMTGVGGHTALADELNPGDQQPAGVVEPNNGNQGADANTNSDSQQAIPNMMPAPQQVLMTAILKQQAHADKKVKQLAVQTMLNQQLAAKAERPAL